MGSRGSKPRATPRDFVVREFHSGNRGLALRLTSTARLNSLRDDNRDFTRGQRREEPPRICLGIAMDSSRGREGINVR